MKTDTWKLAKQVFHEALEETGPARLHILDASCGSDADLRVRVEELLDAHEEAGEFLSQITAQLEARSTSAADGDEAQFVALQSAVAGRYTLERELGRGGMGVVYLARDVSLDRPVAIKRLARSVGGRKEARERFLCEARTSAALSHPNIVPVHAVEEHGDLAFFVMGFVDGETVRDRVRRNGPMSIGESMRMLQEVAWALAHAHGRGVVHRDIKPANIILETESGRAVVTDFGISRTDALTGLTAGGSLLGTPEYVSPEQGVGEEVDGRSDIYSLGVTCFFALTGQLPFEAKSALALITKHLHEPPPPLSVLRPDVPRKLSRAIGRCLEKHPDDRFETAEEVAEAVSEARADVVDVPAPLRKIRGAAERFVMDVLGWGAISAILFQDWVLFGDDPTLEWGIKIGVYVIGIGLVSGRALSVLAASRAAITQGFDVQHVRNAFQAPDGEGSAGSHELGGLRPIVEASLLLFLLMLLALGYMFGFYDGGNPVRGMFRPWYFFAGMAWNTALLILPVFVGRSLGARAIRHWRATRRLWARLWRGRVSKWLFRASGIGLGARRQTPPEARRTEALVAGAVSDLFGSLPIEHRDRLHELPALVARLEAAVSALRDREADLERALAAVGSAGSTLNRRLRDRHLSLEVREYGAVQAHRAAVARDLEAARGVIEERLVAAMVSLENLRLGLIRLQAGVVTPDELTADLQAATEVGRAVQGLVEGERQVEALLS